MIGVTVEEAPPLPGHLNFDSPLEKICERPTAKKLQITTTLQERHAIVRTLLAAWGHDMIVNGPVASNHSAGENGDSNTTRHYKRKYSRNIRGDKSY